MMTDQAASIAGDATAGTATATQVAILQIPEYYTTQSWEDWMECLHFHLLRHQVMNEEMKKAMLLDLVGIKVFGLAKNLITPAMLWTATYAQIVDTLTGNFESQPSQLHC